MAKKNMDALLSNIMGEEIVRPTATPVSQDSATSGKTEEPQTTGKPKVPEDPWKHFSFICSVELADKVQAIALQHQTSQWSSPPSRLLITTLTSTTHLSIDVINL